MKQKRTLATAGLLIVCVFVGYMNRGRIATVYRKQLSEYHLHNAVQTNLHLQEAMAAKRRATATQQSTRETGSQIQHLTAKLRWHCERLVELGHFFHERYDFDQLPEDSDVYVDVQARWITAFPNSPYSTFGGGAFDVYDTPGSKPHWDRFVANHNVPDYSEKYLTRTVEEAVPSNAPESASGAF
ncbi:MAG: hypothetical protein AAF670_04350 [Planctomycetota bacterium]